MSVKPLIVEMFLSNSRPGSAMWVIAGTLLLSACSTGMGAAIDSARQIIAKGDRTDATPLDPKFAYLRVTRDSHVGLLWRGNIEQASGAPVEVYYGASGEVIRLRDGRVVGALGLTTEWRRVEATPPDWAGVARARQSAPFVRVRDVMPGYRASVRDHLRLRVVPPPARSAIQRVDAKTLTWFEETLEPAPGSLPGFMGAGAGGLPPARYAVDLSAGTGTVVYSEQCLSPEFCFTWQRWSAAMQQATAPAAP